MIKKYLDYINEEIDYESLLDEWEENEDEEDDDIMDVMRPYITKKITGKTIYRGTFIFESGYYKYKLGNYTIRPATRVCTSNLRQIDKFYPIIEELKIQGIDKSGSIVMIGKGIRLSSKYTKILDKKGNIIEYLIRPNDVIAPTKEGLKKGLKVLYDKKLKKHEKYLHPDPKKRKLENDLNDKKIGLDRVKRKIQDYKRYIENSERHIRLYNDDINKIESQLKKLNTKEFDIEKVIDNL
jgi:hypothetical protein